MENPIRTFIEKKGITAIEFARIAGTHGVTVAQLMLGYPLNVPKKCLHAIERLGGDPETLTQEYAEWRDLSNERAVV